MSKGKKLTIAVAILLLIAVGAFFAYWYVPRPLVRDLPLVKVQIFDAKTGIEMDLTEQLDLPAVMELLGEAECCPQWRPVLTAMRNIRWTSNFPAGENIGS